MKNHHFKDFYGGKVGRVENLRLSFNKEQIGYKDG